MKTDNQKISAGLREWARHTEKTYNRDNSMWAQAYKSAACEVREIALLIDEGKFDKIKDVGS